MVRSSSDESGKEKKPSTEAMVAPENRGDPAARRTEPPVVYPVPEVRMQLGETPLTAEMARQLLGWEEEEEFMNDVKKRFPDYTDKKLSDIREKFVEESTLKDYRGVYVRCWQDRNNRPLDMTWCRQLAIDILHSGPKLPRERRRWQLNLETVIIGQRGTVMSGQHRLIALVIANQMWEEDGEKRAYWRNIWPTPPTLETLVACGAEERPEVFRTLDNVKPRTLFDVIMTNPFFTGMRRGDRHAACKALEGAVSFLWYRTGAKENPFSPLQGHSESLDFISRHPRLCECVTEIVRLCKGAAGTRFSALLGTRQPGALAALMYLMGCCESDGNKYAERVRAGSASEQGLKWIGTWKRAKEFWAALADADSPLRRLIDAHRCPLEGDPSMEAMSGLTFSEGRTSGTRRERVGVLCKAWNVYKTGAKVTEADLRLEYIPDFNADTGTLTQVAMTEHLTVGGIDTGGPVPRAVTGASVDTPNTSDADDHPGSTPGYRGNDESDEDDDGSDIPDTDDNDVETVHMNRVVRPDQAPVDPAELAERARQERLARGVAETREEELEIRARMDANRGLAD